MFSRRIYPLFLRAKRVKREKRRTIKEELKRSMTTTTSAYNYSIVRASTLTSLSSRRCCSCAKKSPRRHHHHHRRRRAAAAVVSSASSGGDVHNNNNNLNTNNDENKSSPFAPKGSPEDILRVSRQTSFEGLKAARRVALEEKIHSTETIHKAFNDIVENSVRFFKTKAEENTNDADAQFALGNVYQTLEMPEKAIEQYEKTLACSNKTHLDASNNVAMLLQERGEIDKAEAYYLNALTHHPESVDVMFNWASLKVQCRQDLDGARILINRIVTLEPKLKKHPLVKALAGDEIDDEPDEPFVPPI